MEYHFNNGEAVDAIVRVGDFIIPIDAKFSLDNYNRMIESEDKSEIEMLKDPLKMILKKGLMKLQNIFELQKKQQTICLYLQMVYTRIY